MLQLTLGKEARFRPGNKNKHLILNKSMKKEKLAILVGILIVLTGIIDTKFDLLQDAGFDLITINRIKLGGLVLSAVLPGVSQLCAKKAE